MQRQRNETAQVDSQVFENRQNEIFDLLEDCAGACAISGGLYAGHPEQHDGVTSMLPVDLFIPGCPPHPLTILDGFLRLLGRIEGDSGVAARV